MQRIAYIGGFSQGLSGTGWPIVGLFHVLLADVRYMSYLHLLTTPPKTVVLS
jgi:hypothetical protein